MNYLTVIILALLIGEYLLKLAAEILNIRSLGTEMPPEFDDVYDRGRYQKSQEYQKDRMRLGLVRSTVILVLTALLILLGGFNRIDFFARSFRQGEIATGLIFTGSLFLVFFVLSLPFDYYSTFAIEEKYGFNRSTKKTFFLDRIKMLFLGILLGALLLSLIFFFFYKAGDRAWFYSWLLFSLFQFVMLYLSPLLIMPLFNRFSPLPGGALKEAVERYASSQNFTISGIFTMDGSRRSSRANAYFTGFGKTKRVVFYDTMIAKHTPEEIVSILAHELGHYRKRHLLKRTLLSFASSAILFFLFSRFADNPDLFLAFGMDNMSVYAGLVFFSFLFTPVNLLLGLFTHYYSRRCEREADSFAVRTTSAPEIFITALKKLSADHLTNLTPHRLKVILDFGHPPVVERIRFIRGECAAMGGSGLPQSSEARHGS